MAADKLTVFTIGQPCAAGRVIGVLVACRIDSPLQCNYDFRMSDIQFEWDVRKVAANLKKHGVGFDQAKSVFFDDRAKRIDDPDHSDEEDRFVLLGLSQTPRLLLVCHCYRGESGVIRIISARKAKPREAKFYP